MGTKQTEIPSLQYIPKEKPSQDDCAMALNVHREHPWPCSPEQHLMKPVYTIHGRLPSPSLHSGSLPPHFGGPASPQMPCSTDTVPSWPCLRKPKAKAVTPSFRMCLRLTKQSKLISKAGFFRCQPHAQGQRRNVLVAQGRASSAGSHCCPWKRD